MAKLCRPYLERAKKIESGHIPEAQAAYTYEKAKLFRSPELMDEAIRNLNPEWERKFLSKALAERLLMGKKQNTPYFLELASRLFELNPALFVANDLRLPVQISIPKIIDKADWASVKKLRTSLLKAGFREDTQAPFIMQIHPESSGIRLSLLDNNRNDTIYTQLIHRKALTPQKTAQFINSFSTKLFQTRLDQ